MSNGDGKESPVMDASDLESVSVGVVIDDGHTQRAHNVGENAWWLYVTEVLDHVRLPYRIVPSLSAGPPPGTSVLILAVVPALDQETVDTVDAWVRDGGVLITVGDPGDLATLTGVDVTETYDHAHVEVAPGEVWSDVPDVQLHAVGGAGLNPRDDVDVLASWQSGIPAITVADRGAGAVLTCGVDLWQTIVRIQQGYPVVADGKPAADGTAPIDDDILKCEDGMALSFEHDRALPPGEPELTEPFDHSYPPPAATPIFHRPQADIWRSLFLQAVWWATDRAGTAVPWLYYWPGGVHAIAHMSHDSDQNVDEHAEAALAAFDDAGVKVTWCHVFPGGYSPEIYEKVTSAGHENALHFNAMGDADIASWGWPQMRAQYAWAQAITGSERIVSNKNHYTRWENWIEFYQWSERLGIQIDESRGPSKQGSVGFPFGTTHLSFPISDVEDGNRFFDVLNLPLHTQDLAWAGHEANRDVILDGAVAQHGVAHFLFHGPHLHLRPPTRRACLALADEVRRRGMQWWTSAEINDWERRRRTVTLTVEPDQAGWVVRARAAQPVANAAVLVAVPSMSPEAAPAIDAGSAGVIERHGRTFLELRVDMALGDNEWRVSV